MNELYQKCLQCRQTLNGVRELFCETCMPMNEVRTPDEVHEELKKLVENYLQRPIVSKELYDPVL